MKWFRRHIKTGSRLALFALALQFVLSFGHFHFNTAQAAPAIQTLTDLAQAQSLAGEAAGQAEQQPASHDDGQPSNEPCAICTVMAMANQLVFATPALLLLPDAVELLFLATDAEFVHLGALWPAFQSRAPPVS
ncbi:MAG: DUF2946 domain-containing protein [Bradyrhizobium icense]|jgi:hypothetical protein|nr:MAG: DUF2946 domain-containing protein [Bradyrhizobium icense]